MLIKWRSSSIVTLMMPIAWHIVSSLFCVEQRKTPSDAMIGIRSVRLLVACLEVLMCVNIGYRLHELGSVKGCTDYEESYFNMTCGRTDWTQPVFRYKPRRRRKNTGEKDHQTEDRPTSYEEEHNIIQSHFHVMRQLGYKFEQNDAVFKHDDGTDRLYKDQVPWTVDHPDSFDKVIDQIPGLNEYITNKQSLVTRGGKYIPKAFKLPRENKSFLRYTLKPKNKNKIWIQKNHRYRGNEVKNMKDINFENVTLVQDYIPNPFLISGTKHSMGVFVAFSSSRPLRAYVFDTHINFRYCSMPYSPDDLSDPASYVTDGMERGGGVNVLEQAAEHSEFAYSKKLAFKHQYHFVEMEKIYIMKRGKDPSTFMAQIHDAIRDVLNNTMTHMLKHNVTDSTKYFQYTRWDFLLDDNMNIHLIEANLNPYLDVDDDNPVYVNRFYYHLLGKMFRVMRLDTHQEFQNKTPSYFMRDSDVHTFSPTCYISSCTSCESKSCRLCAHCLSRKRRKMLKEVLWENVRRDGSTMVYPVVKDKTGDATGSTYYDHLTDENKLTVDWIRRKCQTDDYWCTV